MSKRRFVIGGLAIVGFVAICLTGQWFLSSAASTESDSNQMTVDSQDTTNYRELVRDNYAVYAIELPKEIDFCGEKVPVDNMDVKERLEREFHVNTYWHSQTFLFLKRAGRWFPIIEPILKENGIPDDFKYLCVIESGLDNVVSPAGASGFWQFMRKTAENLDLEVNSEVDERYHLEKATVAACSYLQDAHNKLGSWTLAAASYNMGKTGLKNRLEEQRVSSYYDLHLNNETSRYMMRIVAAKYILSQPEFYGFRVRSQDKYEPYETKTVTVDTNVSSLVSFAKSMNISYRTLKVLNPWLRSKTLSASEEKQYQLLIPTKGFEIIGSE